MRHDALDRAQVKARSLEKTVQKIVVQAKNPLVPDDIRERVAEVRHHMTAIISLLDSIEEKMFLDDGSDRDGYQRPSEATTREHRRDGP